MNQTNEDRQTDRELTYDGDIETITELSDGSTLKGVVLDLSKTGARIGGRTDGLQLDDDVTMTIMFPMGHDIEYQCEIKHIEAGSFYGVSFKKTG